MSNKDDLNTRIASANIKINKFDIAQIMSNESGSLNSPKIAIYGGTDHDRKVVIKNILNQMKNRLGIVFKNKKDKSKYFENILSELFVYSGYNEQVLDRVFTRQSLIENKNKRTQEHWDPLKSRSMNEKSQCFLVFDNCLSAKDFKSKNMETLLFNGKNFRIPFIVSFPEYVAIPPDKHAQLDYVIILNQPKRFGYQKFVKNMYQYYGTQDKKTFTSIYKTVTDRSENGKVPCMVISNIYSSIDNTNNIYWDSYEDIELNMELPNTVENLKKILSNKVINNVNDKTNDNNNIEDLNVEDFIIEEESSEEYKDINQSEQIDNLSISDSLSDHMSDFEDSKSEETLSDEDVSVDNLSNEDFPDLESSKSDKELNLEVFKFDKTLKELMMGDNKKHKQKDDKLDLEFDMNGLLSDGYKPNILIIGDSHWEKKALMKRIMEQLGKNGYTDGAFYSNWTSDPIGYNNLGLCTNAFHYKDISKKKQDIFRAIKLKQADSRKGQRGYHFNTKNEDNLNMFLVIDEINLYDDFGNDKDLDILLHNNSYLNLVNIVTIGSIYSSPVLIEMLRNGGIFDYIFMIDKLDRVNTKKVSETVMNNRLFSFGNNSNKHDFAANDEKCENFDVLDTLINRTPYPDDQIPINTVVFDLTGRGKNTINNRLLAYRLCARFDDNDKPIINLNEKCLASTRAYVKQVALKNNLVKAYDIIISQSKLLDQQKLILKDNTDLANKVYSSLQITKKKNDALLRICAHKQNKTLIDKTLENFENKCGDYALFAAGLTLPILCGLLTYLVY